MFDKIKRLEKQIKDLEKEIAMHETKRKKAQGGDSFIHGERRAAAEKELQKVKADLIRAKAEKSLKNKNIQAKIDKFQKDKTELARRWVQSGDADVKRKLDGQINDLNKKIDKLERKLK